MTREAEQVRGAGLWLAAQLVALLATVVVIIGLFVKPDPTLKILWGLIIPLVPASLLLSPMLWRNVCPLATLNAIPHGPSGKRLFHASALFRAGALGMVLLGVLVTARHVLFNGHNPTDGPVLGIVVIAVAVGALVLGQLFDSKIGFCNSICPVLPVERLYGQSPLIDVPNPRCVPCTNCTAVGCIDLGPTVSIKKIMLRVPEKKRWFLTSFGIFAAAFPGFVLGYNLAEDGALDTTAHVFLQVGQWTVASFIVVAVLAWVTKARARHFMPALAAACVGIYYWFAGPLISRTFGFESDPASVALPGNVIRVAAFALVAWWLAVAYSRKEAPEAAAA